MTGNRLANAYISPKKDKEYRKMIPSEMSDKKIKKHVCYDVAGGCKKCSILSSCQYGKEYVRRGIK